MVGMPLGEIGMIIKLCQTDFKDNASEEINMNKTEINK
jgi:hypothetical protein